MDQYTLRTSAGFNHQITYIKSSNVIFNVRGNGCSRSIFINWAQTTCGYKKKKVGVKFPLCQAHISYIDLLISLALLDIEDLLRILLFLMPMLLE